MFRLVRRKKDHLFLIGFCSAGKTTVGKLVSERIGRPWMDIDSQLEHTFRATVCEIIETRGIHCYRKREREILKNLPDDPMVISTGSGTSASWLNLLLLQRTGLLVWIEVDLGTALERMHKIVTGGTRYWPELPPGTIPAVETVSDQLQWRQRFYRFADLKVNSTILTPDAIADTIVQKLGPYIHAVRSR